VSTNVTLHAGHDVAYFTRGQGRGGCAGAMSYYTAAGEPPGEWAGKGAAALGLSGTVDPDVIERLYQEHIGPGGQLLVKRRHTKAARAREAAAVAAYLAAHPVRQRRRAGRGPRGRPRHGHSSGAVFLT
jgi:TrwC relaxase